jgi:prepilin-type processing-associated H-X9-DG protein
MIGVCPSATGGGISELSGDPSQKWTCPNPAGWCGGTTDGNPNITNPNQFDPWRFSGSAYRYVGYLFNTPGEFAGAAETINNDGIPTPADILVPDPPDITMAMANTALAGVGGLAALNNFLSTQANTAGLFQALGVADYAGWASILWGQYPTGVELQVTGSGGPGTDTIFRLKEGVERFLITDINNPAGSARAQSTVPIYWDIVADSVKKFSHIPGGGNVLYMDGHVSFNKYPTNSCVLMNPLTAWENG